MATYTYCGNKGTSGSTSGGSGTVGTQQHINGNVVSSGTPVTITPASGNIKSMIIQNPVDGPNSNPSNKVLLVSLDGVAYFSVPNGGTFNAETIDEATFKVDATKNNTKFEIVLEYI